MTEISHKISQVYFIVCANNKIGFGHLSRCLNIAKEFAIRNINSFFFLFDSDSTTQDLIASSGFNTFMLTENESRNPNNYLQIIEDKSFKNTLIITDSDIPGFYAESFISPLRNKGIKIASFVISDSHPVFSDFLINTNLIAESLNFKLQDKCKLLLGPQYFVFNEGFRELEPKSKTKTSHPGNILVVFGSADPSGLTEKVLEELIPYSDKIGQVTTILGRYNKKADDIIEKVKNGSYRFEVNIFRNTPRIHELMLEADLAITSPGLTFWELSLLNIPSFLISSSFREIPICNFLEQKKYASLIGHFNDSDLSEKLKKSFLLLFKSSQFEQENFNQMRKMINPNGVKKLVDDLLTTNLDVV